MQNGATAILLRFLFVDVLLDVVRFPLWWYTRGAAMRSRALQQQLRDGADRLALGVLLKHLGQPMFGDYTKEGRAISFGVRIIQFVISVLLYLVWAVFALALFLAYLLLLPAIVALILYLALPNA